MGSCKQVQRMTLCLLIISSITCTDVSKFFEETKCSRCECYRIKCSRLNDENNCQDTFWGTCDNRIDITEENSDCNSKCDCCLNYECFPWNNFKCIMYRSMHFSILFYFFMLIVMYYSLVSMYRIMFNVNYFDLTQNEIESDKKEKNVENNIQQRVKEFMLNKIQKLDVDTSKFRIDCPFNNKFYIRPLKKTFDSGKTIFEDTRIQISISKTL